MLTGNGEHWFPWGRSALSLCRGGANTAGMSTSPEQLPIPRPSRPWTQGLLTVLVAAAAVYLVTNHWLHILDALPYLWVVLMMSMHLFMHGGHGGHGRHGHAGHGGTGHDTGRPESGGGAGHVH